MCRPFAGRVYRVSEPGQTDVGATADSSREEPGRFNSREVGALYVSIDPQTALREVEQSSKTSMPDPCALFTVDLQLSRMLDLCDTIEQKKWGLSLPDLQSDDPSACQSIVHRAIAERV